MIKNNRGATQQQQQPWPGWRVSPSRGGGNLVVNLRHDIFFLPFPPFFFFLFSLSLFFFIATSYANSADTPTRRPGRGHGCGKVRQYERVCQWSVLPSEYTEYSFFFASSPPPEPFNSSKIFLPRIHVTRSNGNVSLRVSKGYDRIEYIYLYLYLCLSISIWLSDDRDDSDTKREHSVPRER